jgi:hypothetical protein
MQALFFHTFSARSLEMFAAGIMNASTLIVIPASGVPSELADFRRRDRHHPGAVIPLHTTVVPFFLGLPDLREEALRRLQQLAAGMAPFRYQAGSLCTFPTSNTLWLAPAPVAPFERATQAVYDHFPQMPRERDYPTYHMTVGLTDSAEELAHAWEEFQTLFVDRLPLRFVCQELAVYAATDGTYRLQASCPMGSKEMRHFLQPTD